MAPGIASAETGIGHGYFPPGFILLVESERDSWRCRAAAGVFIERQWDGTLDPQKDLKIAELVLLRAAHKAGTNQKRGTYPGTYHLV